MSLSDYESDLTELESSSEEEYEPKKKRGPKKKATPEYKVENALWPPRTAHFTTKSLYDMIMDGTIDLDAPYQRDVVWPETKQVGLIDSIFRNYYIPPIIFACTHDPNGSGSMKRTCIDGKQRLTSIRKFIAGEICHRDTVTGKKYWFKSGPGSGAARVLLPLAAKASFRTKQIVCVEYDNITEEQEREVFQRVQLGVALTPAERMQAISGPWPELIRQIQSEALGDDGFGDNLEWGHSRGRDFQCLASIVYLLQPGQTKSFPGSAQLDKWLQGTAPVPEKLRRDILLTFKIFVHLAKDPRYYGCFQKPLRVSPVEFTMTGVLINTFKDKLSLAQLSSAISKMREDVRSHHVDVRANGRVVKTMQTFIKRVKPSMLSGDKKGDIPASTAIRNIQGAKKAVKRKRAETESSSDSEDEKPLRKLTSSKAADAQKGKATVKTKEVAKSGSRTVVKKVTPKSTSDSKPSSTVASSRPPAASSSGTQSRPALVGNNKQNSRGAAKKAETAAQYGSSSNEKQRMSSSRAPLASSSAPSGPTSLPPPSAPGPSSIPQQSHDQTPPVQVKTEPDLGPSQWPSESSADRLAPLRDSRPGSFSGPTSPIAPEQASQMLSALASLVQPIGNSAQSNTSGSQAPPQDTAALVSRLQSLFASNALSAAQGSTSLRASGTPPTPVPPSPSVSTGSGTTVMRTDQPRARLSMTPNQSRAPTPSVAGATHASSAPPMPAPSASNEASRSSFSAPPMDEPMPVDGAQPPRAPPLPSSLPRIPSLSGQSVTRPALSPTLPVKPEVSLPPPLNLSGQEASIASSMAPPTAPRADRMSRWDQPTPSRRDSDPRSYWDSHGGERSHDRDRERDWDRDGYQDRTRERRDREWERDRDSHRDREHADDYRGHWRGRGRGRGFHRPRGYYNRDY